MGKTINRMEIVEALEKTKPGLANREMIEQSTSFVFTKGMVVTYNDEISVAHPLKALKGIEGVVKAEELYKLLTKMSDAEVDIDIVDNEFRVTTKNVKAGLALEEEIRLPIVENMKPKKWNCLPENFLKALKFVMFSCSQDMSKPVLTCINVTSSYVEASDGYRVTRQNLKSKLPTNGFLIPESSVQNVIRYDVENVAVEEEWAHFQTKDGTILSCRVFNDNYPDIDKMGILEVEGMELQLPNNLNEVIERVAVFAKKQDLTSAEVAVRIADKRFRVKGQSEYGWVEEESKINYKKQPLRFSTNPDFLKDIVTLTQKCTIGTEKMKFIGDGWIHVLALNADEED